MKKIINTMQELLDACLKYSPDTIHVESRMYEYLFKAILVGEDEKQLKKRLFSAVKLLPNRNMRDKKDWQLDLDNRRLIYTREKTALGRTIVLQWKIRPDEDSHMSYTNQQTTSGTVELRLLEL